MNMELLKIAEKHRQDWIRESEQSTINYYLSDTIHQGQGNKNINRRGLKKANTEKMTIEEIEKTIWFQWRAGVSVKELNRKYKKSYNEIFEIIEKYKKEK